MTRLVVRLKQRTQAISGLKTRFMLATLKVLDASISRRSLIPTAKSPSLSSTRQKHPSRLLICWMTGAPVLRSTWAAYAQDLDWPRYWMLWPCWTARLPTLSCHQWYRPHENESDVATDKWYLRALPQDHIKWVLPSDIQKETVWFNRRVTERSGRMDGLLQQSSYPSRKNVLWQNANRDIRGWEINLGWKESSPNIIWQAPSRKVGNCQIRSELVHFITYHHTAQTWIQ